MVGRRFEFIDHSLGIIGHGNRAVAFLIHNEAVLAETVFAGARAVNECPGVFLAQTAPYSHAPVTLCRNYVTELWSRHQTFLTYRLEILSALIILPASTVILNGIVSLSFGARFNATMRVLRGETTESELCT